MSKHDKQDAAVLITAASPSYDDQHAARVRKYALMMGVRFPCLILAGVFYQTWWLALTLAVLSMPLSWIAVLIANDRPPRRSERVNEYQRETTAGEGHELEEQEHRIIDT